LQFSDKQLKFPTEDIMGAHNFKFAPKFPQSGGFTPPSVVLFGRKFSDRLRFFFGGGITPAMTTLIIVLQLARSGHRLDRPIITCFVLQ